MLGRKPKVNEPVKPPIVKEVDVALLMDKAAGDRYIELEGVFMTDERFHLVVSEGLALEMVDLIKEYLT